MSSCRRCGDVFFMATPVLRYAVSMATPFLCLRRFNGLAPVSMATPFLRYAVSMAKAV